MFSNSYLHRSYQQVKKINKTICNLHNIQDVPLWPWMVEINKNSSYNKELKVLWAEYFILLSYMLRMHVWLTKHVFYLMYFIYWLFLIKQTCFRNLFLYFQRICSSCLDIKRFLNNAFLVYMKKMWIFTIFKQINHDVGKNMIIFETDNHIRFG